MTMTNAAVNAEMNAANVADTNVNVNTEAGANTENGAAVVAEKSRRHMAPRLQALFMKDLPSDDEIAAMTKEERAAFVAERQQQICTFIYEKSASAVAAALSIDITAGMKKAYAVMLKEIAAEEARQEEERKAAIAKAEEEAKKRIAAFEQAKLQAAKTLTESLGVDLDAAIALVQQMGIGVEPEGTKAKKARGEYEAVKVSYNGNTFMLKVKGRLSNEVSKMLAETNLTREEFINQYKVLEQSEVVAAE